jgi:hypothetical protein
MPAGSNLAPAFLPKNHRDRVPIGGKLWNRQAAVMRTLFMAIMALAILVGRAHAFDMDNSSKDPLQLKYQREEDERKENERAYNEQMKRLKKQAPATTKNDPWAGVRATDSSKH